MKELIFEVLEDEVDGGYTASALGCGIHTEGDTLEALRENVKESVACHFDNSEDMPGIIRLHFVRDEVLAI
jgi:predicted RNase H-like HicB family nuclease